MSVNKTDMFNGANNKTPTKLLPKPRSKQQIAEEIANMVAVGMPFGNFHASSENLKEKYSMQVSKQFPNLAQYINESGKTVAIENKIYFPPNEFEATILDQNTGRMYSTGKLSTESTNSDFTIIRGNGYTIENTNHNNYVDSNDKITFSNGETTTIGDFLNSQA